MSLFIKNIAHHNFDMRKFKGWIRWLAAASWWFLQGLSSV